jgi:hypothetical protein
MGNKGVFCQQQKRNLTANFLQSILKLAAVKPKNPPNREKTSCLPKSLSIPKEKTRRCKDFKKCPRNNWTGSISFLKFGELRKKHQTHSGRGQANDSLSGSGAQPCLDFPFDDLNSEQLYLGVCFRGPIW